jgi:fumarate hydratase subunit alpha
LAAAFPDPIITLGMREIGKEQIAQTVRDLYMRENYEVRKDYYAALKRSLQTEKSPLARDVIQTMVENYDIAGAERLPMCQDTGLAVLFVELGYDVHLVDDLYESIDEGIRRAVKDGFLRASIVKSPIQRVNTKDNTPAVVHVELVPGDRIKLHAVAKGGGSENKSRLKMLTPNEGREGVKKFVIETVSIAGPEACPPFLVGVGIGGSFDKCAELAKKAILREIGSRHPDPELDKLEQELMEAVNRLGVGPQGLGGTTTALGVFVESYPCHIASLPVAVNMQCNANRHFSAEI